LATNPIIHLPLRGGIFLWGEYGIRKGGLSGAKIKKHAGGMFFSPWENPGAADGIPEGCRQLYRFAADKNLT